MKFIYTFRILLLCFSTIFFISACGGGGSNVGSSTSTDSDNDGVVNSEDFKPEDSNVAGKQVDSTVDSQGVKIRTVVQLYHANGTVIDRIEESFTAAGEVESRNTLTMNAGGNNLLSEKFILAGGVLVSESKNVFMYDSKGLLISIESFDREDNVLKMSGKEVLTYNAKGQLILEEIDNDNDGFNEFEVSYQYNDDGNISVRTDSAGEKIRIKKNTYDSNHNKVKQEIYENGVLISETKAKYDNNNNLLNLSQAIGGSETFIIIEEYTYVNNVLRTVVGSTTFSTTTYKYDSQARVVLYQKDDENDGIIDFSRSTKYTSTGGSTTIYKDGSDVININSIILDEQGKTIRIEYDEYGDGIDFVTSYLYDDFGRVIYSSLYSPVSDTYGANTTTNYFGTVKQASGL